MFQVRIHPISERFVLWNSQHPAMARWSPCHWLSIMGDELQFGPRHGTTWGHRTYAAHAWTRLSNVAANLSIYYYIDIDLDLLFMIFVHHFAATLSESSFAAIKRDESSIPHVSFRGKYNQQSLVNKNIQHVNGFPRSTLCRSLQHWAFVVTGPDAADAALLVWILRPLSFGHTLMNLMRVAAIFVLVGLVCGKFCCRVRSRRQSIHCWTYWV